jgi:hypothetical protein
MGTVGVHYLAELEKAYEARDENLYILKVAPWYDHFRSDPRFQAMLRKMNFSEN